MSQYLHLIATWMQLDVKELYNPLLKLYQKMEHIHALHHKLSHICKWNVYFKDCCLQPQLTWWHWFHVNLHIYQLWTSIFIKKVVQGEVVIEIGTHPSTSDSHKLFF